LQTRSVFLSSTIFISWIDTFLTGGVMVIIWACLSFSFFIFITGGAIKYAFDVTCIDDTRLAISNGDNHQISILNIASKEIEKIINTSYWCYGITQNEGSLLLCEGSRGISRVQVSDNSIPLLVKQETFPNGAYVITSGDNIYHTNTTNKVSCHKINGDKLWEFQDVAIIRTPLGIAVDRDFNGCRFIYSI
jgi:DNA-binding beta-propeller fold protein YncE